MGGLASVSVCVRVVRVCGCLVSVWVLVFKVCGCWFLRCVGAGLVMLNWPDHIWPDRMWRELVFCVLTELGQKWCLSVLAKFGQMCFLMRGVCSY